PKDVRFEDACRWLNCWGSFTKAERAAIGPSREAVSDRAQLPRSEREDTNLSGEAANRHGWTNTRRNEARDPALSRRRFLERGRGGLDRRSPRSPRLLCVW